MSIVRLSFCAFLALYAVAAPAQDRGEPPAGDPYEAQARDGFGAPAITGQ